LKEIGGAGFATRSGPRHHRAAQAEVFARVDFKGTIAIIGAGIGGFALAGSLARRGAALTVYEQAREFRRLGAGIQMSPNAVRMLRALGLVTLL
jgi:NADPH-dependent 2,4-dienoyl-CoA reductase/sulfur reductase-like enzyme